MTISELKSDVAHLGFEKEIEDEALFFASANRALSLIYIDRPVSKTATLSFRGPRITLLRDLIEHKGGEHIVIPITGKSLSFRSSGVGTCYISDSSGTSTVKLNGDRQLTKQFLSSDGSITFTGEFSYTINNLAVFEDLLSNNAIDIPEYSPNRELSPEDYCDGFRAFSGYPKDKFGNTVDAVKLVDGKVIAPFDYRGDLYLTYYRTPAPIKSSTYDEKIDVTDECAPLLPILTASFLWLDDDAGKAQYYMSLYRDMIANIRRFSNNKVDTEYSVNGWA